MKQEDSWDWIPHWLHRYTTPGVAFVDWELIVTASAGPVVLEIVDEDGWKCPRVLDRDFLEFDQFVRAGEYVDARSGWVFVGGFEIVAD
jgi:hypothetical protein